MVSVIPPCEMAFCPCTILEGGGGGFSVPGQNQVNMADRYYSRHWSTCIELSSAFDGNKGCLGLQAFSNMNACLFSGWSKSILEP